MACGGTNRSQPEIITQGALYAQVTSQSTKSEFPQPGPEYVRFQKDPWVILLFLQDGKHTSEDYTKSSNKLLG